MKKAELEAKREKIKAEIEEATVERDMWQNEIYKREKELKEIEEQIEEHS